MPNPYIPLEDAPAPGDWILDQEDLHLVVKFCRYATSPEEFVDALILAGWKPAHAHELALLLTKERESIVPRGTP